MTPHGPKGFGSLALAVALCVSLWFSPGWAGENDEERATPSTLRLSGTMRLDEERLQGISWCGSWQFPVGDPIEFQRVGGYGDSRFHVSRGLERNPQGTLTHEGVDLINGRGGDTVRAAANGFVLSASRQPSGAYGIHVVLAHRVPEGGWVYTVYAHLARGSVRVREGAAVRAGEPLGKVGRTGRATANHLHFEVRAPLRLEEPWQRALAIEPIDFIEARLPAYLGDTTWAGPYLQWAESGGLIGPETRTWEPLRRIDWWRMLARATRHDLDYLPRDPDSLRVSLARAGVLEGAGTGSPNDRVDWGELARDLRRLAALGTRLPASGVAPERHAAICEDHLGSRPATFDVPDARRHAGRPVTVSDACLAIADYAESPLPHFPRTGETLSASP